MGNNASPQRNSIVESPARSTAQRTQPKPRAMSLSCQRELHRRGQEIERKNSVKVLERPLSGSKMNKLFHSDDEYYQKILNTLELPTVKNRRDDSRHILAPRVKGDSDWEKMRLWMMWSIRNSMEKEDDENEEPEVPAPTPRRVTMSQSLETCSFSVP